MTVSTDGDLLEESPGASELLGVTLVVKIGSTFLMLTGLLNILTGTLLLLTIVSYGPMKVAPYLMVLGGLGGLLSAGGMARARDWAAVVALCFAGFLVLLDCGWNLWALLNGAFVMWAFLAMLASLLAALVVPLGVKDCFVASRNRRALLEPD